MPTKPNPLLESIKSEDGNLKLGNFYALPSISRFMFLPTRDLWLADGVNGVLPQVPIGNRNGEIVLIKATTWLNQNRRAEQMTWAPGEPEIIKDKRLISEGGWMDHKGARGLNLYIPPPPIVGDPNKVGPWLEHLRALYPDEAEAICDWFAHRVQRPGEKINHALLLGGAPGIGKDTLLAPLRFAVGAGNFKDISPDDLAAPFNPHVKAVVDRISEAHDLGDSAHFSKFAFYERMKILAAAPPEVLRCNDKFIPAIYIPNVVGPAITTNHKLDAYYLPPDDRRHLVAWSDQKKEEFGEAYFQRLWDYLRSQGGMGHVAAFLMARDLSKFNPHAPPRRTEAFWAIVNAARAPEDTELEAALDELGRPDICSILTIAATKAGAAMEWLFEQKSRRAMSHRMVRCGYTPCRNPNSERGSWKIGGKLWTLYARDDLSRSRHRRRPKARLSSRGRRRRARLDDRGRRATPVTSRRQPSRMQMDAGRAFSASAKNLIDHRPLRGLDAEDTEDAVKWK